MVFYYNDHSRNNAEEALQKLNGTTIGKQMVRLSWGRNPANKQVISVKTCWEICSHYHFIRSTNLLEGTSSIKYDLPVITRAA